MGVEVGNDFVNVGPIVCLEREAHGVVQDFLGDTARELSLAGAREELLESDDVIVAVAVAELAGQAAQSKIASAVAWAPRMPWG